MSLIVNSLWIGRELGPVHVACLRSFVKQGHDVVLHSYGTPIDTPQGVRIFDANRLMGEHEVITHKETGSLALASDKYRYRIQKNGLGIYVDCDIYCLKPFQDKDYILAKECNNWYNPAILKLPYDSQLLKDILVNSEDEYFIPAWLSKSKLRRNKVKKMLGFGRHVSKQEWGVIGPKLLTYHIKKLQLEHLASPIDIYSPMHHSLASLLFEEGLSVNDLTTSRSVCVHLYNSGLKGREIKKNTPLYEILTAD